VTCILYDKACKTTGTEANSENYGKKWFKEAAITTDAFCTHLSYFDEDVVKVAACKEHVGKSAC
jgi:hypothetical protein